MTFHLLFPAAGLGRRFGRDLPKQYTRLHQKTIIEWALDAWRDVPLAGQRLMILAPGDDQGRDLVRRCPPWQDVDGGAERADSVLAGLAALRAQAGDWVLVHDVARPCVRRTDIEKLLEHCRDTQRGALLATPLIDTIKRLRRGRLTTLDRDELWAAQTPQCFRYGELKAALETARAQGFPVTDEASAMEAAGHVVDLVEGSPDNVKLTRADDLALVEFYLNQQGRLTPRPNHRR